MNSLKFEILWSIIHL